MGFILFLIIGGVIGWVASMIMKTNAQMGMIANIIVGIIGASLGGWLAGRLQLGTGPAMGYVFAVIGAVILIAILKVLGIFK